MIRALSPYNYSTPLVSAASGLTCQSYRLDLRIWNGAKASIPLDATESWTKLNSAASTGNDVINIARVLADYIEVAPVTGTTTELINGNAQWWVNTQVVYFTSLGTETPQYSTFNLFGRGYSYGNEGENITSVTDNVLLDGREFKVNRNGIFILPYYAPDNTLDAITVDSLPSGELSLTPTPSPALSQRQSAESTQYLWVDVSTVATDTSIEIVLGVTDPAPTITLLIEDEYKHTPMDMVFINKYGVCQTLTFFKEFESSINIKKEKYETDNGQPSAGFHQFRNINVQGQESFKVQSGWVDETMNETFKQMLLSEQVWHFDGTNHIPLNITSSSLNYKTQKIDRLIQYEVEFDYSYNVINNI